MKLKLLSLTLASVILITLLSVSVSAGFGDDYGYNSLGVPQIPPEINYSKLPTVNDTELWLTDEGILDNVVDIMLSWITNDLGWSVDTNASTCSDGDYLDGSGICIDLNATIDDKIRSIEYNATAFDVTAGVLDAGNLLSIQIAGDDDWLNISEGSGSPPVMDLIVNFTGIENFNSVQFDFWYDGGATHEVEIGVWDCDDNEYEFEYEPPLVEGTGIVRQSRNVLDPSSHICGANKNVSVIFNHMNIGSNQHDFFMDDIKLIQGASISSPVEIDPFSVHKDGSISWQGNEVGNSFNTTNWSYVKSAFGTFSNELFVGNNLTISRSADGGDVALFLRNTAGTGSTDETASLIAQTDTGNSPMGKIVFGREEDYGGGDERSFMDFYVASGSDTQFKALSISSNADFDFQGNTLSNFSMDLSGAGGNLSAYNGTFSNELFVGNNLTVSRDADGGDVALFLRNTATEGGTTETASLIAQTTPSNKALGKIVFGREEDYEGGDEFSFLDFYVNAFLETKAFSFSGSSGTADFQNFIMRTSGNIQVDADNSKFLVGDGQDASIYYNASDMIFDSAEVGSGQGYFVENAIFQKNILINGFLGIGQANPTNEFEILGSTPFIEVSNTAETLSGIIFTDSGASTNQQGKILFDSGSGLTGTSNSLSFYAHSSGNSVPEMVIERTGNVGIAITVPTHTLNVGGDGNFTGEMFIGSPASSQNITMYSPDGTAYTCGVADGGAFSCS